MKAVVPALAALILSALPASAASLCNCCSSGTAGQCATTCAPLKPAEGICLPAVDFAGAATIADGQNPLYDVPLKGLDLTGTGRKDLEAFRKLLEGSRVGIEKDRRAALRARAKGTIDEAAASTAARRYDDAMVNYYLGMNAYRSAKPR